MLIEIKKKHFMEFQDPNKTYYLPLNTYYELKHSKTKSIMNVKERNKYHDLFNIVIWVTYFGIWEQLK